MDLTCDRRLRRHRGGTFTRTVRGVVLGAAIAILWLTTAGCTDLVADGQKLERQGDVGGAVALYQEALENAPDDVEALSGAAVGLLMLGRYDEAVVLQERLVVLDQTDFQTRVELGFNYLNHQDRPVDAVRVLGEAAQLEPSAKNLTFLAQAKKAAGDGPGAEKTLREAIAADPRYAHSYSVLWSLLEEQGRTGEADEVKDAALLQGITLERSQE